MPNRCSPSDKYILNCRSERAREQQRSRLQMRLSLGLSRVETRNLQGWVTASRPSGTLYRPPITPIGSARRSVATMQQQPPQKRAKVNGGSWEHHVGPTNYVTGLQLTDHLMRVPLDHSGERLGARDSGTIVAA